MKLSFLPVLMLFFLACQSRREVIFFPKGSQDISDRRQVEKATRTNAPAGIRQAEVVKVYGINRYVDPSDSRIMHERHAIYRVEQPAAWITHSPQVRNEVILGPIVGLQKLEYAPEPLPGETARELAETRRNAEQANQEIGTMREGQAKLVGSVESLAKQTVEAQKKVALILSGLNERVGHLEGGASSERSAANPSDPEEATVVIHPSNQ
jgi:hypothetical protein